MIDLIFVTYRLRDEVEQRLSDILHHSPDCRLIFTGLAASASVNRNHGLDQVESEIIIMMDDDMDGFYPGWVEDLVAPLRSDSTVLLASARLLNADGTAGPCIGAYGLPSSGVVAATKSDYNGWRRLPTACIAFRKCAADIRFDENFIGSGYEDLDWMNRLNAGFPGTTMVLNNNCRLIHHNEEKRQGGKYFEYNKQHYLSNWPDDPTVQGQSDWTRRKGLDQVGY